LCRSERAIYCDTDSIIAREVDCEVSATKIGAWKIEARGDLAAIAGKKTYAVSNKGEFVKWASKGAEIAPSRIVDIARGIEYDYFRDAPSMSLRGKSFVRRIIRQTV
jgi:hypothetical protein